MFECEREAAEYHRRRAAVPVRGGGRVSAELSTFIIPL